MSKTTRIRARASIGDEQLHGRAAGAGRERIASPAGPGRHGVTAEPGAGHPAGSGPEPAAPGPGSALVFSAYAVLVLLFAGAAAYPLFLLLGRFGFTAAPFHQVTLRILELAAVLGLFPVLRALRLRGRGPWGYSTTGRGFIKGLGVGFGWGVASLGLVVAVLLALGIRTPDPGFAWTGAEVAGLLARGLVTGVLVSLIEESWFRGALHSAVERRSSPAAAILVTALLFAAVHFVRADVPVAAPDLRWWSGFVVIGNSFWRFADPGIVDSLLALFVGALWLGIVRHRSGDIARCIGIHVGWVVVIRGVRDTTSLPAESGWSPLVGQFDGVVGLLAAGVFALFAGAAYRRRGGNQDV